MIVVSNTSPIINLASVDHLDLLKQPYGRIIIPQAVYQQIVVIGAGEAGANEVERLECISTHTVTNPALVSSLSVELDSGEAEAIACALELKADLLLLDEKRGRLIAQRLGLKFIGLLGLLIEAKHKGVIDAVRPILDALTNQAGFWVAYSLRRRILEVAEETE